MLPDSLQDEIIPLFVFLKDKRSKALEDFKVSLCAREYSKVIQAWERFPGLPLGWIANLAECNNSNFRVGPKENP